MARWELEEATALLEGARAAGGFPNRLRHDLSVLYAQQGLFDEALAEIEAAMETEPANRAIWHHFLALQKNNPRQPTAREWRAMHLAFGETVRDRHDERHLAVPRPAAQPRRLRVGYACPDTHLATGRFIWPVLEHFDADALEVFAYWCHAKDPAPFAAAYPRVHHRSIEGLDDEGVIQAIAADAIDIVVEVAGHGSGNVLTALARRPAPVQCTWLDYLATTGMEEIDFRITDAFADPPGAEGAHVERLLRLPHAQWCYRPPVGLVPPALRPAAREGVVFGSVCVPLKLSSPLLSTWARLLGRVPGSRMRFLGIPEGRARARILGSFDRDGIDRARVEFRPRLSAADFFAELGQLDVVLDSHPFSGATSTLDALWQGVPVVTRVGDLSHGRSTAAILATLGKDAWVADSEERLMDIAAELARDVAGRERERASLRETVRNSPLCDGPRYGAAMQAVLLQAWAGRRDVVAPREAAVAHWREVRAAPQAPAPRVGLAEVADFVDGARGDLVEAIGRTRKEWILLTDTRHFDPSTLATDLPERFLEDFDALAALAADTLATGDITAAGDGHVGGVELVIDAEAARLYSAAWRAKGLQPIVLLSGGALLARRALLQAHWQAAPAASPEAFASEVRRASFSMHRSGGRLGLAVGLAAAARRWPDAIRVREEKLAFERWLGLPRWNQEVPTALPLKAAFRPVDWPALAAAFDRWQAAG